MKTSIDIVIVNYYADDLTLSCLESIKACCEQSSSLNIVVHIVCDGEAPTLENTFSNLSFQVHCLMPKKRLGFGACCNLGVFNGKADYILLLNSDTLLEINFLHKLSGFLDEQTNEISVGFELLSLGSLSNVVHNRKFPTRQSVIYTVLGKKAQLDIAPEELPIYNGEIEGSVDQVIGAVWLISRTAFERVKGFDERFFVYYEDVDFSLRLKKDGVSSFYSKVASVYHAENGTSSKFPVESLAFNIEARFIYSLIHFGVLFAYFFLMCAVFIEYPLRLLKALFFEKSWTSFKNHLKSIKLTFARLPIVYRRFHK